MNDQKKELPQLTHWASYFYHQSGKHHLDLETNTSSDVRRRDERGDVEMISRFPFTQKFTATTLTFAKTT